MGKDTSLDLNNFNAIKIQMIEYSGILYTL